ncbi:hypothetical protein HDU98_004505 [Podochytrium sp. JEL0797]|nr:hypothetical protein HDU98_004505 [Podochytrium sp. JEL0797]
MSLSSTVTSVSAACTYAINQGNSAGSICRLAPTTAQASKCYCTASEANSVEFYCAGDSTAQIYVDFIQRIEQQCAAANLPVPSGGTILPLPSSIAFVTPTSTSSGMASATSGIPSTTAAATSGMASTTAGMASATSDMPSVATTATTGMASATSSMPASVASTPTSAAAPSLQHTTAATTAAIPTKPVPTSSNLLGGAFRGAVGFGMVAVAIVFMI